LWEEIIPESYRAELEEEERQKELADLYLGPRQRKTVLAATANDENKENENRKRKKGRGEEDEDEEEEEEEDEDQETPPKKRPKKEEKIHGFNDTELRRFVKSYKKYPLPLTRMEDIAEDADLTDKPLGDLIDLGRRIRERCLAAVENGDAAAADEKKKVAAVKFGGVSVNPKTLLETEKLLRPLGKLLPAERGARRAWRLASSVKDAHFDVDWTLEDDSRLLVGIYDYGLGSWEQAIVPFLLSANIYM
jgi:chromodomain-helicase-DNA-binding protein 1